MEGIVNAVDGVDLEVEKGEVVGLVGESGCGKSTVAFSIMGLVPFPGRILGGKIEFNGADLLSTKPKEMRKIRGGEISMVFQDPFTYLNPVMKIGEQIAENIRGHEKVSKSEAMSRVLRTLSLVGMPSPEQVAKFYPDELSGGMRQRAVIAMAISADPSLLIADEPTTALDVTVQAQILELITRLKEGLGISILLITHDLGVVAEIADKVYVMYAGKIVESGDVYQLFEHARHPYTAGLLDSALSIEEYKPIVVTIKGSVPDLAAPPDGCRFHPRCRQAKEICSRKEPPFYDVENGHRASCWLLRG